MGEVSQFRSDVRNKDYVHIVTRVFLWVLIVSSIIFLFASFGSALVPVNLGVAENFSIVAQSTITDATPSTSFIVGDISIEPSAGSFITGVSCKNVNGTIYDNNAGYTGGYDSNVSCLVTDAVKTVAVQSAMISAYNDARDRVPPDFVDLNAGHLGGLILQAGLYKWSSTVDIATDVILDCGGDVNAVFIFQGSSTLGLTSGKRVNLTGGCQAGNIFWQFDTTVTLGTYSTFEGTILAGTVITVQSGATVNGRVFSQSVVSLDSNHITLPILSLPCIPDWSCFSYDVCQLDNTQSCIGVTDLNTCGDSYLGDYSEFTPLSCDFCTPDWFCSGYGACTFIDSQDCNSATDLNTCTEPYSGDYSEFTPQVCDFCTPDFICNGYGSCGFGDIQSCNSAFDTNSCGDSYLGDYSELLPQTESCDFCTPIYQCSGYGACQQGDVRLCTGVNDLMSCVEHSYAGNLSEFTQSCSFCSESWSQLSPTACNGLISDYTIHYSDLNNCGIYANLPVDNNTFVDCCVESWTSNNSLCNGNNYTIRYTDQNSCGTKISLPVNNGSIVACGDGSLRIGGAGSSTLVSQSVLPSSSIVPDRSSYTVNVVSDSFLKFSTSYYVDSKLSNAQSSSWKLLKDGTVIDSGNFASTSVGVYVFSYDFKDLPVGQYQVAESFDGKPFLVDVSVVNRSGDLSMISGLITASDGSISVVKSGVLFVVLLFIVLVLVLLWKAVNKKPRQ